MQTRPSRLVRDPTVLFMLVVGPATVAIGIAMVVGAVSGHRVLGAALLLGGLLTSYSVARMLLRIRSRGGPSG